MADLLLPLKQFYVLFLATGLLLGLLSRKRVARSLQRLLLVPLFLAFGCTLAARVWAATPLPGRLLALGVGLPLGLVGLLVATPFGREVMASILGNTAYDGLRSRGCLTAFVLLVLLFAFLS